MLPHPVAQGPLRPGEHNNQWFSGRTSITDVKMRSVLGTPRVAAAVTIATAPVAFRESPEERLLDQLFNFSEQFLSLPLSHVEEFLSSSAGTWEGLLAFHSAHGH